MKQRFITALIVLSTITLCGTNALARRVTGVVIGEKNEPLAGATIRVLAKGNGSSTPSGGVSDVDGRFTVDVETGDRLQVSYIGYKTNTISVTTSDKFTVLLAPQASDMDEVVVVGYGTQKKSDIATAIGSVKTDELKRSGSAQTLEALQGKVSGLQILTSDGSLAGGVKFRMRGVNSITGGTQPLFVIDGVPMPVSEASMQAGDGIPNNPLMGLNINDIASMEVLKDAAAAAIYGAKGSNGVVLITTRRGAASAKPKFKMSASYGVEFKPEIPLTVLTPEEYAYKMLAKGTYGNQNLIDFWSKVVDTRGWNDPSVHTWLNDVLQPGNKWELNGSMSGGTEYSNYIASVGYSNNTGVIRRSRFDRLTSRLNLNQRVGNRVNVGMNLSFATSADRNPGTDWSQSSVILNALQRSPFLYYPGFAEVNNYNNINIMSPKVAVEQMNINNRYDELNGNLWVGVNIMPGWNATTGGSYRRYGIKSTREYGPDTWAGQSEQGRMEISQHEENSWVWEARTQYDKKISNSTVQLMGAFEASKWWMSRLYTKATNFEDTYNGIWGIDKGLVTYAPRYDYDSFMMLSWIGRASWSYAGRYVLNASIRADGSSKFGRNNKWGTFPSVSAAWRISEEGFMQDVTQVSNLRVRASFGMTGNNQIPSYQSLSQLAANKVVLDGNVVELGRYPINVANDDLKWESQKQYNVGLDLGLLSNRFQLTMDAYYKRIDDMLLNVNIPSSSGYQSAWKNAGSMENRGVELSLTAHWLRGEIGWSTDFNISAYRNKILKLDGGVYQQFYDRGLNAKITSDVVLRTGSPVGIYYGYISQGVYNNANEVANGYPGSNLKEGELKVVDINRDGVIDSHDRVAIADVNPVHTGGLGNTLSWRGFDLYAFMRWSWGNDVINGNAYYLQGTTNTNNVLKTVNNTVWNVVTPDNNFPLSGSGTWSEGVMRSDLVEDGSFLRLQTLSLGYTVPGSVTRRLGLGKLRVAVTGSNLWLLTRYSGFDPEANTGWGTVVRIAPGMDMAPYPRAKSVACSLDIDF